MCDHRLFITSVSIASACVRDAQISAIGDEGSIPWSYLGVLPVWTCTLEASTALTYPVVTVPTVPSGFLYVCLFMWARPVVCVGVAQILTHYLTSGT